MDYYHNVGSHEHVFVLLTKQLLQEEKAFLLLDYPVGTDAFHFDREGQAAVVVGVLSHLLLEIDVVHVGALARGTHQDVLLFGFGTGAEKL